MGGSWLRGDPIHYGLIRDGASRGVRERLLTVKLLRFELRWDDPGRFFILRQFGGVIQRLDASNYPPWVGVRVGAAQIGRIRA